MRALLGCFLALFVTCAHAQVSPGTSPLTIAKGGTNAATASAARTSLGLAIGTNVEAWDSDLDCLAALATTGVLQRSGTGTCAALTQAQLTALVNQFTTTLSGAVPAPGSVGGKVLADNGTWITVPSVGISSNSSISGASTTYTSAQNNVLVERSNAGAAMSDTLPGTSPGILPVNTLTTVVNNDASALLAISAGSGAAIKGNALLFNGFAYVGPGQTIQFYSDGSNYWIVNSPGRAKLAANTTLSISASGSDTTGNGITSALATTVKAWSMAQQVIDHNGFVVTYSHATGNYAQNVVLTGSQVGSCGAACDIIQGNIVTPSNVTFPGTGSGVSFTVDQAQVTIQGLDITSSGGQGLVVSGNGVVNFGSSACGANTCNIVGATSGSALTAVAGGLFRLMGNYTINGNQNVAWYAHAGGIWEIEASGITVTLSGALTFTDFVNADGGRVYHDSAVTFSTTTATGQRWTYNNCGSIISGGTTYPGSTGGSGGTCGEYD